MPAPGGILAQPWGLLVIAMDMLNYHAAYLRYESDPDHAPAGVVELVMTTRAAAIGVPRPW